MALSFTTFAFAHPRCALDRTSTTKNINSVIKLNIHRGKNLTVARLLTNMVDELGLDVLRQMLKRWSNLQVQTGI